MAKTAAQAESPKTFEMPKAQVGACIWRPRPGGEPAPALITYVGSRAVSCVIFPPDSRQFLLRDGVRHESDPELSNPHASDAGCWDYTEEQKQIRMLLGQEA